MNPLQRILPAAALTIAALAVPSAALAAHTAGSDFDTSAGPPRTVSCSLCTFAMDDVYGMQTWTYGGVITSFKASLAPGTTAKLRVFTRGAGGAFTAIGSSEQVAGTGSTEIYPTRIPVPDNATIGLDLNGSVDGVLDAGHLVELGSHLADGATATGTPVNVEPLLSADVEDDWDSDGLGDDSQDPCVFCAPDPGPGPGDSPDDVPPPPPSGGSSSGDVLPDSSSSAGSSPRSKGGRDAGSVRERTVFTILDHGLVTGGRHPVATVWMYDPHDDALSGTAVLRVRGKVVSRTKVWASIIDSQEFRISPKVARALRNGAKATVSAQASSDGSGTEKDSAPVKFAHPVTTAYDGTWRGAGPLVIKIRGGVVTVASKSLMLMSTRGSGSRTRVFSLPEGVPAIVGRNGSIKLHGDYISDEVRFNATFRRNGTAKGYLSMWHTEFGFSSGGGLQTNPFLGASNWTAKRTGR
jgi:hypothetical protein